MIRHVGVDGIAEVISVQDVPIRNRSPLLNSGAHDPARGVHAVCRRWRIARLPSRALLLVCATVAVAAGCGSREGPYELAKRSGDTAQTPGQQDPLLVGILTAKPPDTPELLQEKRAKVEANLKLAEEAAASGELDQAIQLLEDAVMWDDRHRTLLLRLSECLQTRSQAVEEEDPARAYRLMIQSGGYLRMLQRSHQDFSDDERGFIAQVLFDEARANARSNRHEETSQSLYAAINAGFDDLERLRSEPDFEPLRMDPEMAKRLADAEAALESRLRERTPNAP